MFIGDLKAYVKDGSGNEHLTPSRPQWGMRRQGSFNEDFRNSNRWLCKLSVSMAAL
jgi:hypothetical protein